MKNNNLNWIHLLSGILIKKIVNELLKFNKGIKFKNIISDGIFLYSVNKFTDIKNKVCQVTIKRNLTKIRSEINNVLNISYVLIYARLYQLYLNEKSSEFVYANNNVKSILTELENVTLYDNFQNTRIKFILKDDQIDIYAKKELIQQYINNLLKENKQAFVISKKMDENFYNNIYKALESRLETITPNYYILIKKNHEVYNTIVNLMYGIHQLKDDIKLLVSSKFIIVYPNAKCHSLPEIQIELENILQYSKNKDIIKVGKPIQYSQNKLGDKKWTVKAIPYNRNWENTLLNSNVRTFLEKELLSFMNKVEKLQTKGISLKRNFLLYGPPGTGKSTFIKTFAKQFDSIIYEIDLSSVNNSVVLDSLISDTSRKRLNIILFEDIDRTELFKTGQQGELTEASFLNIIEKVPTNSCATTFLFFTTNNLELVQKMVGFDRPGRVDRKINFDYCDQKHFNDICTFLLEKPFEANLKNNHKITPAIITNEFIKSNFISEAFEENIKKIISSI